MYNAKAWRARACHFSSRRPLRRARLPKTPANPSRWGPDDEIGNANLITAESVLAASELVRTGKTYSLGITIDASTPAFPPRGLMLQVVQPNQQQGRVAFPNSTYNDDVFQGWFGIGSQIDGLGHVGAPDATYYNCYDAKDFAFLTRIDQARHREDSPYRCPRHRARHGGTLRRRVHGGRPILRRRGCAGGGEEAGDAGSRRRCRAVPHGLDRTPSWEADPEAWVSAEPGQTEEVASYLASKNIVAVGADTWGVDVVPPPDSARPFQGHVILLKENGIYILETMNTGPLVRDGAFEFLFVLGHAKVRGAVQMIINPIAIR